MNSANTMKMEPSMKTTNDEKLVTVNKPAPTAIEAIEFFKDGDKDYMQVHVDQLYNMPSIIASKTNIDTIGTELFNLSISQLNHMNYISIQNQLYMITNTLLSSIESNYNRFLESSGIFEPFGKVIPDWRSNDISNESNSDNISVSKIIYHTLFEYADKSTVTMFKDDEDGLKNTMLSFDVCSNQLYNYLTALISFDLDRYIERYIYFSTDEFCINLLNFIKDNYTNVYKSLTALFRRDNVSVKSSANIAMKQLATRYLYNWFVGVLNPLIHNIIDSMPLSMYYIYGDIRKEMFNNKIESGGKQ